MKLTIEIDLSNSAFEVEGTTHAVSGWAKGCRDWWPETAIEAYNDGWESYHASK